MKEKKMSENFDEKKYGKIIPDHEYDGIQELDNPLPGWWLATFYITIFFSIFYVGYYIFGSGPTLVDELKKDLTARELALKSTGANQGPTENELNALIKNQERAAKGKPIFLAKCASCHGDKGQGIIGPNLTDQYWIHGNKPADLYKVISEGVLDKGMPPWNSMLNKEEIMNIIAFIITLKDTNPPNAKAPQGVEYKD
jgi:cytochrome c oxidase cbb3-type subunit 3